MTSPIKILRDHNLKPSRRLGQNFLKDPSTADMIISRAAVTRRDVVLEIGAGLGALTIPLSRHAKKVYAVEKDRLIFPLLQIEAQDGDVGRIVLLNQDILKLDLQNLAETEGRDILVMGNLPYNLSSRILIQLISARSIISRAVLMFQKELIQRIVSPPGSRDYGRLSVMLQYCARVKKIAEIKSSLFYPRPKVDSAVVEVHFKKTSDIPVNNETFLFKLIKAAFSKRRKMLKNTLAASELGIDIKETTEWLKAADIDPGRRAETLTVEEFIRLANLYYEQIGTDSTR
jgi:16S rRNA (adenine1518-N6/adenine1519-N6)-dimethyltransferase